MQVSQARSVIPHVEHSPSTIDWTMQSNSVRDRSDPMVQRVEQPLIFSIDDRLAEQHLTRLDLSSKRLKRIEPLPHGIQFNILVYDQNEITKIEHLDALTHVVQLSMAHNRLDDIRLLSRLRTLQKLNLSYNLIESLDSLRTLHHLVMINLSNNNLVSIAALNACTALQSLDASCNAIQQIDDLSRLTSLKYLNLHKNYLDTLLQAPRFWPKSLHTLIISDNELQDLTEISYLSSFIDLNVLYIDHNPCLFVVDDRRGCHQPFDHRPYVLNWCLSINNLDGVFITRKESLKAEWLLSQGKGRSFRAGEHEQLVEYLTKVCGTDANERDDLHLSRIMFQQEMYQQNRQNPNSDMNVRGSATTTATSDTMRDAFDTISSHTEGRVRSSTITMEAEVVRDVSVATPRVEVRPSVHARTPSPNASCSQTLSEDCRSESRRYNNYDNRPIKPLDQQLLQTKLNEYPLEDSAPSNSNASRTRSPTKRSPAHLAYNANRYSPKTTARGPTASNALHGRSTKTSARYSNVRTKRASRTSANSNATRSSEHSVGTAKVSQKCQTSTIQSIENTKTRATRDDDDDDDEEEYDEVLTTAPLDQGLFTRSAAMNNSIEIQKLTSSMETMRTSVLQAYFDLHDRFTKTTELQTSALTALWQKCENQTTTFQRETERMMQENRLLHQRIQDLERRLDEKERHSSLPTPLHPPLRAHISKRDTKSFFLHWIPNPLNEQRKILGYRIYIDDRLKGTIDPGQFEAIIDCIRDEGEYRIKIRTYDEHGESPDSNIVVARFRRQHSTTPRTDDSPKHPNDYVVDETDHGRENLVNSTREETRPPIVLEKRWSDSAIPMFQQEPTTQPIPIGTPEETSKLTDDPLSSLGSSPLNLTPIMLQEHIISRKPPRSPTSSPIHSGKVSPSHGSCMKALFTNTNHQGETAATIRTAKRSPTRTGIMSRLTKSPYRVKRTNNALIAALPSETNATLDHDLNEGHEILSTDPNGPNASSPPPPLPPRMTRSKTVDGSQ